MLQTNFPVVCRLIRAVGVILAAVSGGGVMAVKVTTSGVVAGLLLGVVFSAAIALIAVASIESGPALRHFEWWQHEIIYHAFIPSFYEAAESDMADGMGDLEGKNMTCFVPFSYFASVSPPYNLKIYGVNEIIKLKSQNLFL